MASQNRVSRLAGVVSLAALACAAPLSSAHAQSPSLDDLRSMSLEELAGVPVTVVQRRVQTLREAPDSVYVITPEAIRRSGAVFLPEALRLAPNLQVARDNANSWAISARGMNSVETANKLLVMVDTRSIYSPLHAGVFWGEEPVLLEDIERIEVASGPGGALWGANAVNGVINVITKNSFDTHGAAARLRYGTIDSGATARVGGALGQNVSYRVYGSAFRTENTYTSAGTNALDDYDGVFGGMRIDGRFGDTTATLQAEGFDNNVLGGDQWGGHVRGRIAHNFAGGQRLLVQAYYDTVSHDDPFFVDRVEVADLTFQYNLAPMGAHQVIAGGGYRHVDDAYYLPGLFHLDPPEANHELLNAFIQDTITFSPQLNLTLGVKVEDSSYSGFEYMPSARLAWTPDDSTVLWGAVSRAVRTPVRLDRDLVATGFFIGGPDFDSEELIAYELGYRGRPTERTSLTVELFLHDYDDLRTTAPLVPPPNVLPAEFANDLSGQTYGVEAWGDFQVLDWWLLRAGAVVMQKDYTLAPGARDISDPPASGNDPSFQFMLRSRMDLTPNLRLDAGLRWVDDLPGPAVPGYVEMDARLAWRVNRRLELAIVGNNLLHDSHPETSAVAAPNRIRRGVFVDAIWGF